MSLESGAVPKKACLWRSRLLELVRVKQL